MSFKELQLGVIRTDGGTQMRASISEEVYFDYRDKWLAGVEFDPIDVYHDGAEYWLADGFHRFYGAREAKLKTIRARVHRGTRRDAILFATGANAAHGQRRTNADKRLAVETLLDDEEWCKWSDVKIAEQASVSQEFVRQRRHELTTVVGSPAANAKGQPRTGRDGKRRKPPKPRALKPAPPPSPPPSPDDELSEQETDDEPEVHDDVPRARGESETLQMLKHWWNQADSIERAEFIEWTDGN
jgi:hypothetical protein